MSTQDTPIGTIFLSPDKRYWKITGEARNVFGRLSYPVICCTKNGKEFSQRDGFNKDFVDKLEWGKYKFPAKDSGKVSRDGVKIGAVKRRLQYLRDRMKADSAEIEEIKLKYELD